MIFDVFNGRTLSEANWVSPKNRSEAYEISPKNVESREGLREHAYLCSELANFLYWVAQDQFEGNENIPDDWDGEAVGEWIRQLDDASLPLVVGETKRWLEGAPDLVWEDGASISAMTDGQEAALRYFRDNFPEEAEQLKIRIVEGDHPMSSYYAAELTCTVEEANNLAQQAGLNIQFREAKR